MELSPRVRAVCDLDVSEAREFAGRHEYDGKTQDLSPAGVRAGLARLAEQADAERDRLHALLADGCARIDAGRPALDVARELVRDHPDGAA